VTAEPIKRETIAVAWPKTRPIEKQARPWQPARTDGGNREESSPRIWTCRQSAWQERALDGIPPPWRHLLTSVPDNSGGLNTIDHGSVYTINALVAVFQRARVEFW